MRAATYRAAMLACVFFLSLTGCARAGVAHPSAAGVTSTTNVQHIVWAMMENHTYNGTDSQGHCIFTSSTCTTTSAPYIVNTLAATYGSARNVTALFHPSLPNYLAYTSGSNDGITTDCSPSSSCDTGANNIFNQLGAGNWRALEETMPSNCDKSDSGNYAVRHNPPPYYTDLGSSCGTGDVPLGSSPDLSAPFTFVTPNLCHDMHSNSCTGSSNEVQQGDNWLKAFVPTLLSSPQYAAGNTVIFVTWDEGIGTNQNIPLLVIDPFGAHTNTATCATATYTYYSLLKYTEDTFGLSELGGASSAKSLAGCFGLPTPGSITTTAPTNTGAPVISGTPIVGNTLTSSTGTWSGNPTSFSYNWQRCVVGGSCSTVTGFQSSNKYVVQSADVGFQIHVQVKACNSAGCTTATNAARTAVVTSGVTPAPFPSRLAACGQALCDSNGFKVAAPGAPFKGFDVQIFGSSSDFGAQAYADMKAQGAKYVRLIIHWNQLEPTQTTDPAQLDQTYLTAIDNAIADARAAGLYSYLTLYFTQSPPSYLGCTSSCMSGFMITGQFITSYLANRYGNPSSAKYDASVMGYSLNETGIPPSSTANTTLAQDWATVTSWVRGSSFGNAPAWIMFVPGNYAVDTTLYNDANAGWNGTQDAYANFDLSVIGSNVVLDLHGYPLGDTSSCPNNPCDGRDVAGKKNLVQNGGWFVNDSSAIASPSLYATYPTAGQTETQALADLKAWVAPYADTAAKYNAPLMIGEWSWPSVMTSGVSSYVSDERSVWNGDGVALEGWWDFSQSTSDPYAARPGGNWNPAITDWFSAP